MYHSATKDLTRDLLTIASGVVVKIPEATRLSVCKRVEDTPRDLDG